MVELQADLEYVVNDHLQVSLDAIARWQAGARKAQYRRHRHYSGRSCSSL